MKTKVSLVKCPSYDEGLVLERIQRAVDLVGGWAAFIKPGSRVLLKPNLLTAYPPERAVTTHPAVVAAVIRLLKDRGAKVYIGDSPGIESVKSFANYERVLKISGIADVAKRYGAECIAFKEPVLLPKKPAHIFKELRAAEEVLKMDAIVNLPKFKTHVQMYLTLAVKNMFGCVIGNEKAHWHFHAGRDYAHFARMLVELYDSVRPTLNILDGVVGMEGDGPSAGTARDIGLIMASADGVALDRVACEIVGGDEKHFFTLEAAKQIGCGETSLSRIELAGEGLASVKVAHFKLPRFIGMYMGPEFLQGHIRALISARPVPLRRNCKLCGVCVQACPAAAITKTKDRLIFAYDKCIGCFCCAELCMYQALQIRRPLLGRLVQGYARHKKR
ncbi:MAG TPA: DUF362 domain-containing protein [Patescibacteria group bacterium]|nr:DUF362 domain-containing protein [Patescibacteria group bacterium]